MRKNKLISLLSIPAFVFGLNGCRDNGEYFCKQKDYGEVVLTTWRNAIGTHFRAEKKGNSGALGSLVL